VASLSQGRTAAAQCGLFTHKSVPVIFEPPCISQMSLINCKENRWEFSLPFTLWLTTFAALSYLLASLGCVTLGFPRRWKFMSLFSRFGHRVVGCLVIRFFKKIAVFVF